jgi:Na+-transporting methylmalonyl-CoA/oxaloacetate decarboxylase gamma subunit
MLLSFEITLLGMGIVFGAIILLWGMMTLLTWLLADKEPAEESAPEPAPVIETDARARAVAVAVALALAESEHTAHPLETPPTQIISAWQLGMRTRRLVEKGGR